jgi:lactate dehydrogenase-like 2-hydroxyacid dehydrogenase
VTVVAGAHDKLRSGIDDVDVVVLLGSAGDAELIAAGRFGLIQQCGVGVDRIDVEAATATAVWVADVPALNSRTSPSRP